MIGAFIVRTVLIYSLGISYVGLDGLFSSILTVLNMAELGFSTAIVFKLYKPIAEGQSDVVCALLNYYKKVYRNIGMIILTIGLVLLPFLRYFVKNELPGDLNLYLLYIVYLGNTCLTYWLFAYKTALLNAHQRNDYISKVNCIVCFVKYTIQTVLLILFKNYYVYIIIIPLGTILTNIGNAVIARRKYPQYFCKGDLGLEDRKEIYDKISALLYDRIGVSLINGSDNIIISAFLGLTTLGIYTSYYYVFSTLHTVFSVFYSAIVGGIGNKIITETTEENFLLFKRLSFINFWAVGFCSICLCCLYEPFICIWLGSDKSLGESFAILMGVYFFSWMIRFIVISFKNAQGLWREDRFRALCEGGLNLFLNIIMVQFIGIYGIVLSTIIAMLAVSITWESRVLFKNYFEKPVKNYFKTLLIYFVTAAITGFITHTLCTFFTRNSSNIESLVIRSVICVIVPNILFLCFFHKSDDFKYMIRLVINILKRERGK